MQQYFDIQQVHFEGECDLTITQSGILYSIGQDDLVFKKNLKLKEQERHHLSSEEGNSYISIAANDNLRQEVMVGGLGKSVQSISMANKDDIKLVYKFGVKINELVISKKATFLAISLDQSAAALYHIAQKKMVRCRPQHTESVVSVFFSNNQKYICSTGTDGIIRIYSLQNWESPQQKYNYKLSKEFNSKENKQQILRGMWNIADTIVACPGKPFLQIVQCVGESFHQTYKMNISHKKDITICHWQNDSVLVTGGLDIVVKVWNFYREEQLFSIDNIYFTRISSFENTFYGINHSGSIYSFKESEKLNIKSEQAAVIDIQNESNVSQIQDPFKNNDLQQGDQQQSGAQKYHKRLSKSKADKIITQLPQEPLNRITDFYANNRFLFYNTIGCIIQRSDTQSSTIEVQYHDTKLTNKNKTLFTDRQMNFFDVQVGRIAYANYEQYGFFGDCFWEHKIEKGEQLIGIALGNEWVAVATKTYVLIFDLAGNNINNIAFDRHIVSIAAYQDLLAVAYVDSIPMWGCQNLKMNIWNINGTNEPVQNTYIPLRPKSVLKTFNFSEQGLIYAQDSHNWIRVFNAQSRKWTDIFNPRDIEGENQLKLWIVGISNYELIAFKLSQQQFEPTVLPRTYPRKIKVCIPNPHNRGKDEIYSSSKAMFGEILWKKIILQHERHRYRTWYRYKFSRADTSYNYSKSASILSEQELNIREHALDVEFIFLVKNLLLRKEAQRALITSKTFIKSERQLKKIIQIFKQSQLPQLAAKLTEHYDEQARLQQYDLVQKLKLKQLQQDMQVAINYKPIDPMNPRAHKIQNKTFVKPTTSLISSTHTYSQSSTLSAAPKTKVIADQLAKTQNINRNPFSRTSDPLQQQQIVKRQMDNRMSKALSKHEQKKKPSLSQHKK